MRGTIDTFNFRQLNHNYLLLVDDARSLMVAKQTSFPYEEGDNAILLYGYIDKQCGLSFEMLAFANVPTNGPVKLRESSKDTAMKFRYDSIQGTVINVDYNKAMEPYQWRVDSINNGYSCPEAAVKFRDVVGIDKSRHPQFPDDIVVFFIKDGYKPEGIWCRICGEKNGRICGAMMNKPYGDFGKKNGDIVEIELVDVDGELKAVAVL